MLESCKHIIKTVIYYMTDCLVFSSEYQKMLSRTATIMLGKTLTKFFVTYLVAKPLILVLKAFLSLKVLM